MLTNPYRQFLELMPARPLQVATVDSISNGVATLSLPGGGQLQARGEASTGQRVFVRDGVIEGIAPALTYVEGEG